jgi:hypothetical protein
MPVYKERWGSLDQAHNRRSRTIVRAALLASVFSALLLAAVPSALAASFTSTNWKWSPKGDAKLSGSTTIRAREHFGTGEDPSDAAKYTTFVASNRNTKFYDKVNSTGAYRRLSRNKLFRHVRIIQPGSSQYHAVAITWIWRRNARGARYRYIKSIRVFDVYG